MRLVKYGLFLSAPLVLFFFFQNMVKYKDSVNVDSGIGSLVLETVKENLPTEISDQIDDEKLRKVLDKIDYKALTKDEDADDVCHGCAVGSDGTYTLKGKPFGSSGYQKRTMKHDGSPKVVGPGNVIGKKNETPNKAVVKNKYHRKTIEPVGIKNPYDPNEVSKLIEAAKDAKKNMELHYQQIDELDKNM